VEAARLALWLGWGWAVLMLVAARRLDAAG